jgi:hypothetical protein
VSQVPFFGSRPIAFGETLKRHRHKMEHAAWTFVFVSTRRSNNCDAKGEEEEEQAALY